MASYTIGRFITACRDAFSYLFSTTEPLEPPPDAVKLAEERYHLSDINATSAIHILPDGRKLGYAQYGAPSGTPILYMHGLPGSRIEAVAMDGMGRRLNARIIAADRPGYGWSDPHPGRTILDTVKDVETLADYLELKKYGVLGISGGGPYALACAYALPPDKLKAVTSVCGLGPPPEQRKGMNPFHWCGFAFGYRYFGWAVRWYFSRDIVGRLDLSDEERLKVFYEEAGRSIRFGHKKDVEVFEKHGDRIVLMLRTARQSFAQGFRGFSEDGKLLSAPFGFEVSEIRADLPVFLWYGTFDTHVPPANAEYIATHLPGGADLKMKGETHASICFNWQEHFVEELVRAVEAAH